MSARTGLIIVLSLAGLTAYGISLGIRSETPPKKPAPPDTFASLGNWALSDHETLRLVHIPDAPTGLRCLIYTNATQTVLRCDDDLPRNLEQK